MEKNIKLIEQRIEELLHKLSKHENYSAEVQRTIALTIESLVISYQRLKTN